jgi:hypothetical protein
VRRLDSIQRETGGAELLGQQRRGRADLRDVLAPSCVTISVRDGATAALDPSLAIGLTRLGSRSARQLESRMHATAGSHATRDAQRELALALARDSPRELDVSRLRQGHTEPRGIEAGRAR